jgi:hypothetical protein
MQRLNVVLWTTEFCQVSKAIADFSQIYLACLLSAAALCFVTVQRILQFCLFIIHFAPLFIILQIRAKSMLE